MQRRKQRSILVASKMRPRTWRRTSQFASAAILISAFSAMAIGKAVAAKAVVMKANAAAHNVAALIAFRSKKTACAPRPTFGSTQRTSKDRPKLSGSTSLLMTARLLKAASVVQVGAGFCALAQQLQTQAPPIFSSVVL